MNREETIDILRFCKGIWKDYYKGKGKREHNEMIDEWCSFFKDIPQRRVKTAVYCLAEISTRTHPTKEEVKKKVEEVFQ